MTTQDEINNLNKKLKALINTQRFCNHKFCEPYEDLVEDFEPIYELKHMGVHYYQEEVGSRVIRKRVWQRKCDLCGITQTRPYVLDRKPIF